MKPGFVVLGTLALLPVAALVSAQSSVGFYDPSDLDALLQYRLPDWGYWTLMAGLDLSGRGDYWSGAYPLDESTESEVSENLTFRWFRESERREWALNATQFGAWDWRGTDGQNGETINSRLQGAIDLQGNGSRYLDDRFFLSGGASATAEYGEARDRSDSDHDVLIARSFRGSLSLGVGYGRVRNVTPVLQAQRLSERLTALGREPLSQEEVLRIASVLAQNGGYQAVFDRPDRRLWQDVMEPLLARGESLSPFEVFYLSDLIVERLGFRREGWEVDLRGRLERRTGDGSNEPEATHWGPQLGVTWYHNISLNHQLSLNLNGIYEWPHAGNEPAEQESGFVSMLGEYLWVLADRVFWTSYAQGILSYDDFENEGIYRRQSARLATIPSVYVEDRLILEPRMFVDWNRTEFVGQSWTERWSWNVGMALRYDLDNLLY